MVYKVLSLPLDYFKTFLEAFQEMAKKGRKEEKVKKTREKREGKKTIKMGKKRENG